MMELKSKYDIVNFEMPYNYSQLKRMVADGRE